MFLRSSYGIFPPYQGHNFSSLLPDQVINSGYLLLIFKIQCFHSFGLNDGLEPKYSDINGNCLALNFL